MKTTNLLFILIVLLCACNSQKKINDNKPVNNSTERSDFKIMFYNVENLFDTYDDSLKRDEEFLPESMRRWSAHRYYKKLHNISKVIIAVGDGIKMFAGTKVRGHKFIQKLGFEWLYRLLMNPQLYWKRYLIY